MNRVTLKIMLAACENKLVDFRLQLEARERADNNEIQGAHELGQRLGEHYWQESHVLRQKVKSAELLRETLLEALEENKGNE